MDGSCRITPLLSLARLATGLDTWSDNGMPAAMHFPVALQLKYTPLDGLPTHEPPQSCTNSPTPSTPLASKASTELSAVPLPLQPPGTAGEGGWPSSMTSIGIMLVVSPPIFRVATATAPQA